MALTFPSSPSTGQVFNPGPGLPSWMWDGGKWTSGTTPPLTLAQLVDVGLSTPANGQLLTYSGTRWVNGGNAVISGGSAGNALTVNGATSGTAPVLINGIATSGLSNGLSIIAGTTAADNPVYVVNQAANALFFKIAGNGSGQLGPNATNTLSWTVQGSYSIAPPISGTALNVQGISGQPCFITGLSSGGTNNPRIFVTATETTGINLAFTGSATSLPAVISTYNNAPANPSITLSPNGAVTIGPPAGGAPLTVQGVASTSGTLLPVLNTSSPAVSNISRIGLGVLNTNSGYAYAAVAGVSENAGNEQVGLYLQTSPAGGALTNRVIISGFGNVTVNTPGNNGTALQASGPANGTGIIAQGATGATGCTALLARSATPSSTNYTVTFYDGGGGQRFFIRGDGPVGFPGLNPQFSTGNTPNAYIWGDASGQLTVNVSSARFKRNIHSVPHKRVKEILAGLRAVNFCSKCPKDDPDVVRYGFIAEEVAAVDPGLADYDADGQPINVNYHAIAALLVPLMQELLGMDEPEGVTYG